MAWIYLAQNSGLIEKLKERGYLGANQTAAKIGITTDLARRGRELNGEARGYEPFCKYDGWDLIQFWEAPNYEVAEAVEAHVKAHFPELGEQFKEVLLGDERSLVAEIASAVEELLEGAESDH